MQNQIARTIARGNRSHHAVRVLIASLATACLQASSAFALTEAARKPYQVSVAFACNGFGYCKASFPTLPPKHSFDVAHVRCSFKLKGSTDEMSVSINPNNPTFSVPFGLIWLRKDTEGRTAYTFDSPMRIVVPRNAHLEVSGTFSGTAPVGHCSAVGDRVIYQ